MAFTNADPIAEIRSPRVRGAGDASKSAKGRLAAGAGSSRIYQDYGKRALDVILVIASLPIVLPVIFVLWFITALDGGNAFYSQKRVGKSGKLFRCWKLRTMVPDADQALAKLIAEDKEIATEWARDQKLAHDPRITRWGRLLRRSSLDELPQLLNVLVGDMSLIGPRPFTQDQKELYDRVDVDGSYYKLRPGVSGLWQVKCRNRGVFADRIAFDQEYGSSVSLIGDIRLILGTLRVVMRATGQ